MKFVLLHKKVSIYVPNIFFTKNKNEIKTNKKPYSKTKQY